MFASEDSLENVSSLVLSLRGCFICQIKLPKRNTALLKLQGHTLKGQKKDSGRSSEQYFFQPLARKQKYYFFWPYYKNFAIIIKKVHLRAIKTTSSEAYLGICHNIYDEDFLRKYLTAKGLSLLLHKSTSQISDRVIYTLLPPMVRFSN